MTEVNIVLPRKNFDVVIQEIFSNGITGIYGPSGSGKTSLLHSIAGLAHPQSGHIKLRERTIYNGSKKINTPIEKRNIGYVFQEGRLFPHLTVEKNLLYGYKKKKDNTITIGEIVELLNLKQLLKSRPMQISGGERQRTALGRSLLASPDILLLDEPFSAVDNNLRGQIIPFINKIQERVKIPILVVSHELPDLLKMTSTLCIIKEGRCIGHGQYYDLLKNNASAEVIGSSSLVNSIEMRVLRNDTESGLTILGYETEKGLVKVKCEKSNGDYKQGQFLKIYINADDIALANNNLAHVTIQNQIEGIITDIIDRKNSTLCIVNVGFKLIVEITIESKKRMNLILGKKICCLFKSVAIDVAS